MSVRIHRFNLCIHFRYNAMLLGFRRVRIRHTYLTPKTDMKICLYAHDWNYIDNYEPVTKILESQNINFDILVLKKARHQSFLYFSRKYKKKYGPKFITIYDIKFGKEIISLSKLPVIGLPAEVSLGTSLLKYFLVKKKYTHIVVSDDSIIEACILIKAANEARIKNVVLYPVEGLQIVKSLMLTKIQAQKSMPESKKRRVASSISRVIYPKNSAICEGKPFYFFPPNEVLRLGGMEIFPKNPCVRGANKLTKIAANSMMQARENYVHGVNANKIFITGFPPHDKLLDLIKNREQNKARIKSALHLDPNKKIFLIAGTNYSDDFDPPRFSEIDKDISRVISILSYKIGPSFDFIFKINPRVVLAGQEKIFSIQWKEKIKFVKDEFSIYELVTISDAILNFISASMDASLITDAPIFCYKIPGRMIFEQEIARYKSITPLYNIVDLERNLSILGKIPAFDEILRKEDRKNFGIFDGRNAERFVSLL